MSIKHHGTGHLFSVPDNLKAYQDNADGDTWGETQMEAFAHTPAGQWLEANNVPYDFHVKVARKDHGQPYIVIRDDEQAMRFKLANAGV